MTRKLTVLIVAAGAAACAAGPQVDFRIVVAPPDRPLRGAETISVVLEREGAPLPETEQIFPAGADRVVLGSLPHGRVLRLRVEARAMEIALARGRSFPFDLEREAPERPPDVWLGTLGRFGQPSDALLDAPALAAIPTPAGALAVTASGSLVELESHRASDARADVVVRGHSSLRGVHWAAVGRLALAGAGGAPPHVEVWDAGPLTPRTLASPSIARHGEAFALVGLEAGLLLVGGRGPSGPNAHLTRIDVLQDELSVVELPDLPRPVEGARALAVPVRAPDGSTRTRVLVLSPAQGWALAVDPTGEQPPRESVAPLDLAEAAILVVARGLVLVAGGRDAAGRALDRALLLVLDGNGVLDELTSPPLFAARAGAVATSFGAGLALVVGGRGEGGVPLASAELFQVALDELPGEIAATGSMPVPVEQGTALPLDDGTVLVLGQLPLLYFPPREPAISAAH